MTHSENNRALLTIGRGPDADFVLQQQDLDPVQAVTYLDADGFVWIEDNGGRPQLQLKRAGEWLNVLKLNLCAGDRIKMAGIEIPVEELTRRLSVNRQARLKPVLSRVMSKHINRQNSQRGSSPGPLRNPTTGNLQNRDH